MSNLSRSQREALRNRANAQQERQHIERTQQGLNDYWKQQNQKAQDYQDNKKR